MAFVQQGDSPDNSISPSNVSHHSSFLPLPSVFFFFSFPTTSTFFPTSGTGASFLFTRWLSNKLCIYSCFHLLHACCLVSLSRLWSLLTSSPSSSVFSSVFFGFLYLHSAPTLKHSGSRLVPILCRFHSMSKGGCSSVSLCQWSPFRAVGSLGLFCLMSCKESFLCPWSIANTFLPTMGIWKGWIAMWCLLSQGGLAASRSSVSSLSSLR